MLHLSLRRFLSSSKGTLGVLLDDYGVLVHTLELPWLSNTPRVSSIPTGSFRATRVVSPKFGPTFDVEVPQRDLIRFHPGNTIADTDGCILTGCGHSGMSVVSSREAFARFLAYLNGVNQFVLHVEAFRPSRQRSASVVTR